MSGIYEFDGAKYYGDGREVSPTQPETQPLSAASPFRAYWKTYPPEGGTYSTRLLVIEVTYGNGEVRKVSCTPDEASELAAVLASEHIACAELPEETRDEKS